MRRDIGNELVVAIAAVGVLAFALIFGIVLSLSSTTTTATATLASSEVAGVSPSRTTVVPTPNATEMSQMLQLGTQVVALLTASAQAPATVAASPTDTVTRIATEGATETQPRTIATQLLDTSATEAASTAADTFTPRATATEEPTDTLTRTRTTAPSDTAQRTATSRPTNTVTSSPTETLPPPTPNVSATFEVLRASASAFAEQTSAPSASATNTAAPTRTPRPTNTPEPTNSPTLTASRTPTQRASNTPLPSPTRTTPPTQTPEPTAIPPSPTNSSLPTQTPEPTAIPPTASYTFTATPSLTPTRAATVTPLPSPTNTTAPTATATSTHVVTNTATPTSTPTSSPTPTGTPFVLPTAIVLSGNVPIPTVLVIGTPPVPVECSLPQGWAIYIVQPGDTLFRIALAVNSTVGELRDANCLQNIDNIYAGTELFVPRLPLRPVQPGVTPALSASSSSQLSQGCTFAGAQITAPAPGTVVTGVFTVFGTATVGNFQYYRIEVRPSTTSIFNFYDRVETPVVNNALAQINSDLFDDGLHWVRLTVVDNTGNFPDPCAIPLIFH